MNVLFVFWSFVLIVSLSSTGLAIRSLALNGIPLSESLIVRGLVCSLVTITWAHAKNLSLVPKSIKTQVFRALIAGLALSLFSLSYNWLSASTIAVLSNIDVPLLVILGSMVGTSSRLRAKVLSLLSIMFLVFYGLNIQEQSHWVYGLSTLSLGLLLLCFGYYFIKKSMSEENRAITVLTPSIAIIVYGFFQTGFDDPIILGWTASTITTCILSGVGMFGAYYATMKLYDITDIAMAEFPTLIASLAIQPIEAFLFHETLVPKQVLLTIAFIGSTYYILKSQAAHAD